MSEELEKNDRGDLFSKPVRAGKRTYFFDVKSTRGNDYYLTITERKKGFGNDGKFTYEKHKIFLYKEDFNKFLLSLTDVIDYVKTELLPDYNYDEFSRIGEYDDYEEDFHQEEHNDKNTKLFTSVYQLQTTPQSTA